MIIPESINYIQETYKLRKIVMIIFTFHPSIIDMTSNECLSLYFSNDKIIINGCD